MCRRSRRSIGAWSITGSRTRAVTSKPLNAEQNERSQLGADAGASLPGSWLVGRIGSRRRRVLGAMKRVDRDVSEPLDPVSGATGRGVAVERACRRTPPRSPSSASNEPGEDGDHGQPRDQVGGPDSTAWFSVRRCFVRRLRRPCCRIVWLPRPAPDAPRHVSQEAEHDQDRNEPPPAASAV